MDERYDAKTAELKWMRYWQEHNIYQYRPEKGKPYVIDTPPPTVSGAMHVGHVFSYAQQDFIARYQRMKGMNVYYPFGTDDNGLPTERMVERLKKVKSTRMSRPEFVRLCRDTLAEIKDEFAMNWIRIGMSCDFSKPYSTIDPHCIKTSQKSFLELYKKGLIYRKDAPTIWCVSCQTAIAQAELEDKELPSTFNDIAFRTETGEEIIIATTRSELIPACVCLYVHPDDLRYKHLVGKQATVPLFNYTVPILADPSADPEKGSGMMMVCSYGDKYDVEALAKRNLQPRVCFTKEGKLNTLTGAFAGMSIKDARKAILVELDKKGLLKAQKPIVHAVNVHDKCGTEIEFLPTQQWFIRIMDNKQQFLDAADEITWHPESMKLRYQHWVKNLSWDWCISRQRHFGVPFPIWYDDEGNVILAEESQLPVDPLTDKPAGHPDTVPEQDVMDTWATSSMTPQIITNWAGDAGYSVQFSDGYPTMLRPQAHEIIRTWAFYTIVKGIYHHGKVPWQHIMISGNVADPTGQKMSKSKGNVVDPQHVMEKYSADALRFWAAGSKLGEDLAYLEKELVAGSKMITKLWNASKFAFTHLQTYDHATPKLELIDEWMLAKLSMTIHDATDAFEQFEYSKAKAIIERFFWDVLCDNYLEMVKERLYGEEEKSGAQHALYTAIRDVTFMLTPLMPFITEEVYQQFLKQREHKESVHLCSWPSSNEPQHAEQALKAGDAAVAIIAAVRKEKSENKVSLKTPVRELIIECPPADKAVLEQMLSVIISTTATEKVTWGIAETPTSIEGIKVTVRL